MLPFHITRLLGLKSETHGFVLVDESGMQLVFRDTADIKSAPDDDAESLRIKWSNVARLEAKRGVLSDQLLIEVHAMPADDPDGTNDNLIQLELQKRDRDKLDRFEKLVEEYRSGAREDDVDDVLDDVRDLLDRM